MTTGAAILVLTAFLASAVEAVEALTVVLAVGVTRSRRSSLIGAGTATLALVAVIAAGVVMALILSAALAHRDLHAWWVLPVTVVVMLAASLWREVHRSR
jgi:uncharacterized membrane protein